MSDEAILADVEKYYSDKVRAHGATAKGVDWNSPESQQLRFDKLLTVCSDVPDTIDILDYGCGYGALADTVASRWKNFRYTGFDLSEEMLQQARKLHPDPRCSFVREVSQLSSAEFSVASGIFNVRLNTPADKWETYMHSTIADMARLSSRGFSFNALSAYSDADKKRSDLYYADPLYWFDHVKRNYSRHVALLHDYPLYEFTLVVRLDQ